MCPRILVILYVDQASKIITLTNTTFFIYIKKTNFFSICFHFFVGSFWFASILNIYEILKM